MSTPQSEVDLEAAVARRPSKQEDEQQPSVTHVSPGRHAALRSFANLYNDDCDAQFDETHTYSGPQGIFKTRITQGNDKAVVWDARTHRRNMPQRGPGTYRGGDPEKRTRDPMWYVSAASGPLVLFGALLRLFGAIGALPEGYYDSTQTDGGWGETRVDWLVNIPSLAGSTLLTLGGYCSVLEVLNVDYRSNMRKWYANPKVSKPRVRWNPLPPKLRNAFLSYYGAYLTFLGGLLFIVGNTAALINGHHTFSDGLATGVIQTPLFVAAVSFLAGGYLLAVEARNSWLWALAPPLGDNVTNAGQWAEFVHLVAVELLIVGSALAFGPANESLRAYRLANGLTFVPLFALLVVQGVLNVYETFHSEW